VIGHRRPKENEDEYRLRQYKYFLFKGMSQTLSQIFYIIISPCLRYGLNRDWSIFQELTRSDYHWAMIFAAASFGVAFLTTWFGTVLVRWRWPQTHFALVVELREWWSSRGPLLMYSLVMHNAILAVCFILVHYRIWYGWQPPGAKTIHPPPDSGD
jgi:putative flippase GtrA